MQLAATQRRPPLAEALLQAEALRVVDGLGEPLPQRAERIERHPDADEALAEEAVEFL